MTTEKGENLPPLTPQNIFKLCATALLSLGLCFGAYSSFISEVNTILNIGSAFFIKQSTGKLLLVLFILPFLLLAFAMLQRLLKFKADHSINWFFKSALAVIGLFVSLIMPLSFYIDSMFEDKGYSYCAWYTGASPRAPDVWLKNDDFCLQAGSVHIALVREYFDNKYAKGEEPDLVEFKQMLAVENAERDELLNRL